MKVILIKPNKVLMTIDEIENNFYEKIKEHCEEHDIDSSDESFMTFLFTQTGVNEEYGGATSMCYEGLDKKFQLFHIDHRTSPYTEEEKIEKFNIIGTNLIYRGRFDTCCEVHSTAIFFATEYNSELKKEQLSNVSYDDMKDIILKRYQLTCIKIEPNDGNNDDFSSIHEIKTEDSIPIKQNDVGFDAPSFGYNIVAYIQQEPVNNKFNKLASLFFTNPVYGTVIFVNMISKEQTGYLSRDEFIKIIKLYQRLDVEDINKLSQIDDEYFTFRNNLEKQYNKYSMNEVIKKELKPPLMNYIAKLHHSELLRNIEK
jgi:hypothetical protein